MAVNEFDGVAPVYDALARLVFGNKLSSVQQHNLDVIQPNHQVLILGGGTGKLLEDIPRCEQVDFLDKSPRMIRLAQKRNCLNAIQYITADFLEYETSKMYDVVICPFFLDCFNEENLTRIVQRIRSLLNTEGKVIVSDFQRESGNGMLLKMMHWFFRMTSRLESRELLDIRAKLSKAGLKELDLKSESYGLFGGLYQAEHGN